MGKKPKIYDCFLFYNELELLEIRLKTLNEYVDKFVLVEATKTFSNKDKELYYNNNKELFAEFHNKIIHIIIDEHPGFADRKDKYGDIWQYEYYQRNCIEKGLTEAGDDDIIILSDLDEIPNPKLLQKIADKPGIKVFKLPTFYYFLNLLTNDVAMCCRVFHKHHLDKFTMQEIRSQGDSLYTKYTGWHFSYLGDKDFIKNKIKSFAHQQYNKEEVFNNIEENIEKGVDLFNREGFKTKYIKIDNNFPKYIVENIEKFKHLIKKN